MEVLQDKHDRVTFWLSTVPIAALLTLVGVLWVATGKWITQGTGSEFPSHFLAWPL